MDTRDSPSFDRAAEDAGNILSLEHCNIRIPEQRPAILFFIEGLGLTRDPYMHVTDANMWVNAGRNQFHLPTNVRPQVFRGEIAVVVPHLDLVRARPSPGRMRVTRCLPPVLGATGFGCTRRGASGAWCLASPV